MIEKVTETIVKYQLLSKGERVIVGFSGGVDSLCLLHVLSNLVEFQFDLWALYINHSLRPSENILEERLLDEMGERFRIHTKMIRINLPERLQLKPQSLQLLARQERYRIFEEFRLAIGATKVALAHHRDDQAETVLYRLIRGTGLDGLAGIPVQRGGIFVRPLLYISRAEIMAYAIANNLSWIEDSSNQKLIYQRNRIRHQLIPEIETQFNPRFKDALTRLANLATEQRNFMEMISEEKTKDLLIKEPDRIGFSLDTFLQLHPYLQYWIVKKVLTGFGTEFRLESKLQRLLTKIQLEAYGFHPWLIYQTSKYIVKTDCFFLRNMMIQILVVQMRT